MKGDLFRRALSGVVCTAAILMVSYAAAFAGVPSSVFQNVLSYNNHVYAVTSNPMSWADASTLAAQHGGHLVTVNDAAENQFLAANYPDGNPWIGLNNNNISGAWNWDYGWSDYRNWSPGEPSGGLEHCVVTN